MFTQSEFEIYVSKFDIIFFELVSSAFLFSLRFVKFNIGYKVNGCSFSSHALADLTAGVGGIVDVPLAQTGEGIAECELLKWFVQEVSDSDCIVSLGMCNLHCT